MICETEGVYISANLLQNIVSAYGSDTRRCLNILQFYTSTMYGQNSKCNGQIIISDYLAPNNTIFDVLTSVISLDNHSKRNGKRKTVPERCATVLSLIHQLEDTGRFYNMLFHNLSMQLQLSTIQYRNAAALFVDIDLNLNAISSGQHFVLYSYQPFIVVAIHLLCAIVVSRRLAYDFTFLDHYERAKDRRQIINSIKSSWCESKLLTTADVIFLIPYLQFILQPPIQQPNTHLQSGCDSTILNRLVHTMIALGISYASSQEENFTAFSFHPPIHCISCFHPTGKCEQKLLDAVKKFVIQQMRAFSMSVKNTSLLTSNKSIGSNDLTTTAYDTTTSKKSARSNLDGSELPFYFNFKYNQGSSQAIRRNIRIESLFR